MKGSDLLTPRKFYCVMFGDLENKLAVLKLSLPVNYQASSFGCTRHFSSTYPSSSTSLPPPFSPHLSSPPSPHPLLFAFPSSSHRLLLVCGQLYVV